jgi:alpha-N-arabinofuranosidase
MRAVNGSPQPFHVQYWEIGNEVWGDWVRGHSDATTYANNLNRYVEKMKAVDPSIRIIATGDNNLEWNRTVLTIAGKNIDYLSVHHYYGPAEMKGDANNLRARPLHYEEFYRQMQRMIRELAPATSDWPSTSGTQRFRCAATLDAIRGLTPVADECF